ncbi:MAG: hypothetical protein HQ546_00130, partial [Planctomycetes bacterium]|nr:hypothetical protein [Planctomycetota bacterium]
MSRAVFVVIVAVCGLCASSIALQPAEILVVVNKNMDNSVALGRFYCARRGVPTENLVAVDVPTGDEISAQAYQNQMVIPLRQAISDRNHTGQIRCILTVYGIPFRLAAAERAEQMKLLLSWSKAVDEAARKRLAVNMALLNLVGRQFPAKAQGVRAISRPDDLFDEVPAPPPLKEMDGFTQVFGKLVQLKASEVNRLADWQRRAIAQWQILSISFDAFGLIGLRESLNMAAPEGAPDPKQIDQQIAAAQEKLKILGQAEVSKENLNNLLQSIGLFRGAFGIYTTAAQNLQYELATSLASVDSELSLLLWNNYEHEAFHTNPLHWRMAEKLPEIENAQGKVLMVSRIDGPEIYTAMRLVLDAIAVEKQG